MPWELYLLYHGGAGKLGADVDVGEGLKELQFRDWETSVPKPDWILNVRPVAWLGQDQLQP